MKVFALAVLSLSIPSVCSAHSGALLNTVANYLPLLAHRSRRAAWRAS